MEPLWNLLKSIGVREWVHRRRGFYTGFTQVFSHRRVYLDAVFSTTYVYGSTFPQDLLLLLNIIIILVFLIIVKRANFSLEVHDAI